MHYQDAREAFKISTVNLFAVTSVEGWLSAADVTLGQFITYVSSSQNSEL